MNIHVCQKWKMNKVIWRKGHITLLSPLAAVIGFMLHMTTTDRY